MFQCSFEVPDFDFTIISTAYNPMVIEPNASNQLIVSFKNPQTFTAFNIPQPDGKVRTSTDDQVAPILQARDSTLVAGEGSHKLTRGRMPDLDGPVTRGRDDISTVEVNDIHSCPMADQCSFDLNIIRRVHVPHDDLTVLGTSHHQSVHEPQMKNRLFMVVKRLDIIASLDVPHADCRVTGPAYNDILVVLETQHASCMPAQSAGALSLLLVPDFDCVVA